MTIKEIKNRIEHRPWEMPKTRWSYYQEWNNAVFLHWEVDSEILRKFVPNKLEIDLIGGNPWVSLVAFTMEKIRPRNLPHIAPISNFDEINIRTYVKSGGKTGVYFLSIEGGKRISCKIAKSMSELPYRYSEMKRKEGIYKSENTELEDSFEAEYKVREKIKIKSETDIWLTERYALFQDSNNYINEFEIHHQEWELNQIELNKLEINYPRFSGLINNAPNKAHYSKGVKVIAWDKVKK